MFAILFRSVARGGGRVISPSIGVLGGVGSLLLVSLDFDVNWCDS